MAYTLRMMTAIENYLLSKGCQIIGPMSGKDIPHLLFEQCEQLPPVGLKRFIRHGEELFILHVFLHDWLDRMGSTLNIHAHGTYTTKITRDIADYYSEFDPARFLDAIDLIRLLRFDWQDTINNPA